MYILSTTCHILAHTFVSIDKTLYNVFGQKYLYGSI
jgi:hypothetical protein